MVLEPQNSRIHIRNPNKDPRFLNQVPTLHLGQILHGTKTTRANTSPLCHVHEVPDLASKDSNLFLYEFLDEHPKHKTLT